MDSTPSLTPQIAFEDFLKVDIRAGTILSAEKVEKSKKLLKLIVDFGELGTRQILAGIGHTFEDPSALVNYQATFVVNLAPRQMMGLESHGMILAMQKKDGNVQLTGSFNSQVENGTQIG